MLTFIAAAAVAAAASAPHYKAVLVPDSPDVIPTSSPNAINDKGVIVGDTTLPDYTRVAYSQAANGRNFRTANPFGGTYSAWWAIASNGDKAGASSDPGTDWGGQRPVLVIGGATIAPLPFTDDGHGQAFGINAKGAATGTRNGGLGWIWHDGTLTEIPSLGGSASIGEAINAHGDVAGEATETGDGVWSPILFRAGTTTRLPVPGNRHDCKASALNDSDHVVGSCVRHGVLKDIIYAEHWHDGVMTELPDIVSDYSYAYAINDAGLIVGWSAFQKNGFGSHAVLWQDGVVYDLNDITTKPTGVQLDIAIGITTDGHILALGSRADGTSMNYVLAPVATQR